LGELSTGQGPRRGKSTNPEAGVQNRQTQENRLEKQLRHVREQCQTEWGSSMTRGVLKPGYGKKKAKRKGGRAGCSRVEWTGKGVSVNVATKEALG